MIYDAKLMASKLGRWETYMDSYQLPTWEELPDLELYMDQLISQVRRYLSLFPEDVLTCLVLQYLMSIH